MLKKVDTVFLFFFICIFIFFIHLFCNLTYNIYKFTVHNVLIRYIYIL